MSPWDTRLARQSGRATGLRVATAEIADLGELVHLTRRGDLLCAARADHSADEREGIALAVEAQSAARRQVLRVVADEVVGILVFDDQAHRHALVLALVPVVLPGRVQ